jgi:hypothetical protein
MQAAQGATTDGLPTKAKRLQELQILINAGSITAEEYADARQHILRN